MGEELVPNWAPLIFDGLSKKCGVWRYHDRAPRLCDWPVEGVFIDFFVQFR